MHCGKIEKEENKKVTLEIRLGDADWMKLAETCGRCGLTADELLSIFLEDIWSDKYSERPYLPGYGEMWLERCGFSYVMEETLLKYLSEEDMLDYFIELIEEIKYTENDLAKERECPEPDWEFIEDDSRYLLGLQEEYEDIIARFLKKNPDTDIEQEIELCAEWKKEIDKIFGREDEGGF